MKGKPGYVPKLLLIKLLDAFNILSLRQHYLDQVLTARSGNGYNLSPQLNASTP